MQPPTPISAYNFPKEEEKVGNFWNEINIFDKILEQTKDKPKFVFYDGPPFATGTPHYGHILVSIMKDVVCRYQTSTGHHVPRRFGWDCHGLPIERIVDVDLNVQGWEDIVAMPEGIKTYNDACRSRVMRYADYWRVVIGRIGRWIDFDNDYRTMYPSFMESVWWAFQQMYNKGLVYRGTKVMPWSTALGTCLSNSEASQNYQNVVDPCIWITFPLVDEPDTEILAWTTTPWTLPSNLACCVHPRFEYAKIQVGEKKYIILNKEDIIRSSIGAVEYTVLETYTGSELAGKKYVPLFDFFVEERGDRSFKIIADEYVTDDSGTGIVHCAPGFGDDDFRVCLAAGITLKDEDPVCPIDGAGRFLDVVKTYAGKYVKDADRPIINELVQRGRLIKEATIEHSYPFCYRSQTPLLYRTVPSWYINVQLVKERMVENNKKSVWVPPAIQHGRFHNWISNARDWSISRYRYFGTPIPIWANEDYSEIKVVGSIEELHQLSGVLIDDLHRENVDDIVIKGETGDLHRIKDVFDCWFESGSMPFAQLHYPFENADVFEENFPADFCAEALDQTRGWFYTLLVIATALFDKPAFKNLIVNGLVLAADGKKMSKSLKNYPDPMHVIDKYGADALRLYLINSPTMRAEDFAFKEEGVERVLRNVLIPWYSSYIFLVQNVARYEETHGKFVPSLEKALESSHQIDRWILSVLSSLISFVKEEMEQYRLYTVVPRMVGFVDLLTNVYIRLNRSRIRGQTDSDDDEYYRVLSLFYHVMLTFTQMMTPFTPYLAEVIFSNLKLQLPEEDPRKSVESIHMLEFPSAFAESDPLREQNVQNMLDVISAGRLLRDSKSRSFRMPIARMVAICGSPEEAEMLNELKPFIIGDLNLQELEITTELGRFAKFDVKPNFKVLGPKLGSSLKDVGNKLSELTMIEISKLQNGENIEVDGFVIEPDDCQINVTFISGESEIPIEELTPPLDENGEPLSKKALKKWQKQVMIERKKNSKNAGSSGRFDSRTQGKFMVVADFELNEEIMVSYFVRLLTSRIQKLRQNAKLTPIDAIKVYFTFESFENTEEDFVNEDTMNKVLAGLSEVEKNRWR
eukprot:TRINITY_DN3197_c1_g6_i2.p1 TRINITY_DN3197_c1_g6~~TRINITY_DN3197_c1_g6_i2.p1  ORF type:complete len:1088 (+),score=370.62 TRINITY_DN3197_c1_g6_i2:32-3295(+)